MTHIHNSPSRCCVFLCLCLSCSPSSSEHSYVTVCRLTIRHFQHPRKHNVSLLSPSCIRALFGLVWVRWGEYVHAHEPLSQHHLMAVTHWTLKYTHKHTCGVAVVENTMSTAWKWLPKAHSIWTTKQNRRTRSGRKEREMCGECGNDRRRLWG